MQELLDTANAYLLPVYARPPFVLAHGKGAYVWDTQERKYLDFCAGIAVNALGHADEGVAKVSHRCRGGFVLFRCSVKIVESFPAAAGEVPVGCSALLCQAGPAVHCAAVPLGPFMRI